MKKIILIIFLVLTVCNILKAQIITVNVMLGASCTFLSTTTQALSLTEITISPNPTTYILNITTVEKADYKLLNIRGQVLKTGVLATVDKIDISSLSKGIYFLNIKTSKGSFTKKVVRE